MARHARHPTASAFAAESTFDEQLYAALRQSPWWLISIATHVLLFVIAGLLTASEDETPPPPSARVQVAASDEVEPEPPKLPNPSDRVVPTDDPPTPVPVTDVPEDVSEVPQADVDLPFDETLGESDDGMSLSDMANIPSNTGLIGLGPGGMRGLRGRGGRRNAGQHGSGGDPAGRAVEDALRWLAAHQSPNGSWEAATFHRWCEGRPQVGEAEGLGGALHDTGVSGLALLAFLGAGYTHRGDSPYARTVASGLRWLKDVQDAEGCFGPRASQHFIYNHATAALAMVEAYGMTGSTILRSSAQKALDFIGIARNPYFAWRYGVKPGDNDTSVTGWMMMALKSAKLVIQDARAMGRPAPLAIDEEAFSGIQAWIDKMTDPDTGRVGYIQRGSPPARPQDLIDAFPPDRSESCTAVGILARIFMGEDPRTSEPIRRGAALCTALPPRWELGTGDIDMYYWYYGSLALYQVGGPAWKAWRAAMEPAIVDHQRQDGDVCAFKGSWDPVGPWGPEGGRVYSTALMAMCLEVYYRYDRVFGTR